MKLLQWLKTEPAVVISFVTAAITLAVSFGITITERQTAAVIALVIALMAIGKALSVRPFYWPIISGALQAGFVVALAFNAHISAGSVGAIMAVVNIALGVVVRQAVTPETKLGAIA